MHRSTNGDASGYFTNSVASMTLKKQKYIALYLPSHVFFDREPLMLLREAKLLTLNTCVLSGSVAMAFSSASLIPEPTPMEKTVTPWALSKSASEEVAAGLLDWPE